MSKKFMIDTSVIIDNPEGNLIKLSEYGKNKLYITEIVLEELDKHKTSLRFEVAISARAFFRALKKSKFKKIKDKKDDVFFKVNLVFDNEESVELNIITRKKYSKDTLSQPKENINDAKIREVAASYNMKCITNDISFKARALANGLKAESIHWDSVENPDNIKFDKDFYFLSMDKEVETEDEYNKRFTAFKYEIASKVRKWTQIKIIFKNQDDNLTGVEKFYLSNGNNLIDISSNDYNRFEIKPINLEQKFYVHMLESNFNVMTVSGKTGTGKTLLALQEGMRRVKDPESPINGIIYMRFTVNAEDKFSALGYRKGGENEKLDFYNYPLYGAINFIIGKRIEFKENKKEKVKRNIEKQINVKKREKTKEEKLEDEKAMSIKKNEMTDDFIKEYNIEILDIAHARGITMDNKYVIFDEIQNAPNNIVRLIGTRLGKNSIGIFMGDYKQVDHPYLSQERNGLVSMLNTVLKDDFVAAIKLVKTVRSETAKWFEERILG